jgi:tRNA pseudouridine55 synthase
MWAAVMAGTEVPACYSEVVDGALVVDKPETWTSHDVVARVRTLARTKKIGHLGTLDPMATGVLPLVIGRATRLAQFYGRDQKIYEGVIRFGYSTHTYDKDGQPTSEKVEPNIEILHLEQALAAFRGTFLQTPPPVSAKKVRGTPAHRLVRRNEPVELTPVEVTVHSLELLEFTGETVSVRIVCSAGTYLRSIAHDLGRALGCGAHLETLRRTASGEFKVECAHTLKQLETMASEGRLEEAILPASEMLPAFPTELIDPFTAGQIRQGRDFRVSPFRLRGAGQYVKAVTADGELVAIGEMRLPNLYHPMLVFQALE